MIMTLKNPKVKIMLFFFLVKAPNNSVSIFKIDLTPIFGPVFKLVSKPFVSWYQPPLSQEQAAYS